MKFNLETILSKSTYLFSSAILAFNMLFAPVSYAHKDLILDESGHYVLDVYADYFPPYQNISDRNVKEPKNNKPGLVIEILRELDRNSNLNLRFHYNIPRKRIFDEIISLDGLGEIVAFGVKTKEREKEVIYSKIPISSITWRVYSLPGTKIKFSQAKSVIVPLGYAVPEELIKGKKILTSPSEFNALKMLEAKRAKYVISSAETFKEFENKNQIVPIPNIKIIQDIYAIYDKNLPQEIIENLDSTLIKLLRAGIIKGINAIYEVNYNVPKIPK